MSAPFRSIRRRIFGFNLIEVAIIMAVTGVIAGAVVIPVAQLLRNDGYEWQERQMALIQEAILGYAALHRTPHNVVVEVAARTGFPREGEAFYGRTYNLPAGRPYLPCPDVNGDGYEDRVSYGVVGEIPQGALEPLATRQPLTLRMRAPTPTGASANYNSQVEALGRCAFSRGLLPWLSLGVPPADRWGNAYTYQVDDIFADSLAGFNQNSQTDEFEIRARLNVESAEPLYPPRGLALPRGFDFQTDAASSTRVRVSFVEVGGPVVVCDGTREEECYPAAINSPRPSKLLQLAGGQQTSEAFKTQYREHVVNAVTEGVPYAVISHGRNGHGAINHARLAGLKREGGNNGLNAGQIACNWPIHNANFAMPPHLDDEAINFPNANSGPFTFNPARTLCNTNLANSGSKALVHRFVMWQPPREGRGNNGKTFDDVVVWIEREQLLDLFTHNKTFPAPDYPAFRPH